MKVKIVVTVLEGELGDEVYSNIAAVCKDMRKAKSILHKVVQLKDENNTDKLYNEFGISAPFDSVAILEWTVE